MDTFSIILNLVRTDFKDLDCLFEHEELCEELTRHKLGTYALHFGKDNFSTLKQMCDPLEQFANVRSLISELKRITKPAGIPCTIIKGLGLNNHIYGSNPVRTFGDLDILVRKEDTFELNRILNNSGFFQNIGVTSVPAATSTYARAFLAAHARDVKKTYRALPFPVKSQRNKPEYFPYVRKGMPSIEVHDGLYFLSEANVKKMLESTIRVTDDVCSFTTLNAEYTFILLLINTFENSESFYSNTYDFGATLRDYVDLRFFFETYKNRLDWTTVAEIIQEFSMCTISGTVLGNLHKVYGRDVTSGSLSSIVPLESEWGVSILERIQDPDLSRRAALSVMQKRWFNKGVASPINVCKAEKKISLETCHRCLHIENICFNIEYTPDSFILTWVVPPDMQKDGGDLLYQFTFFSLTDQVDYTSYKVDISYYDGECKSYGRSTKRCRHNALKKESTASFPVTIRSCGDMCIFQTALPFSELGMAFPCMNQSFCVSADVYRRHFEEIYYQISATSPDMSLVEINV